MVKDGNCSFGDKCWFCHDADVIEAATRKKQNQCKHFQDGRCHKGDACPYSHEASQNGTGDISTSTVAISCIAQTSDGDCSRGFVAETPCKTMRNDLDADSEVESTDFVEEIMKEREKGLALQRQLEAVLAVEKLEETDCTRTVDEPRKKTKKERKKEKKLKHGCEMQA